MSDPITFTDPSFAIFDVDANVVRTTANGLLAIFSTRVVAESMMRQTPGNLKVVPVLIKPMEFQ